MLVTGGLHFDHVVTLRAAAAVGLGLFVWAGVFLLRLLPARANLVRGAGQLLWLNEGAYGHLLVRTVARGALSPALEEARSTALAFAERLEAAAAAALPPTRRARAAAAARAILDAVLGIPFVAVARLSGAVGVASAGRFARHDARGRPPAAGEHQAKIRMGGGAGGGSEEAADEAAEEAVEKATEAEIAAEPEEQDWAPAAGAVEPAAGAGDEPEAGAAAVAAAVATAAAALTPPPEPARLITSPQLRAVVGVVVEEAPSFGPGLAGDELREILYARHELGPVGGADVGALDAEERRIVLGAVADARDVLRAWAAAERASSVELVDALFALRQRQSAEASGAALPAPPAPPAAAASFGNGGGAMGAVALMPATQAALAAAQTAELAGAAPAPPAPPPTAKRAAPDALAGAGRTRQRSDVRRAPRRRRVRFVMG
jgi:hypothetical protein